jgi:hypothetical protein
MTVTFLDGSTFKAHRKSTIEATPQSMKSAAKIAGTIFMERAGSREYASSSKVLAPEKGEPVGKGLSEGTIVYTLPGK